MLAMFLVVFNANLVSPILVNDQPWESAVTSFYYLPGNTMANGEEFRNDFIAAHKKLPFGTIVELSYQGRTAYVQITDRGPFKRGRQLDVSRKVAEYLGFIDNGVVKLKKRVVYTPPT